MTVVKHIRKRGPVGYCKAKGCEETIFNGNKTGFCRLHCNSNEARQADVTLPPAPWEEAKLE